MSEMRIDAAMAHDSGRKPAYGGVAPASAALAYAPKYKPNDTGSAVPDLTEYEFAPAEQLIASERKDCAGVLQMEDALRRRHGKDGEPFCTATLTLK